MTLRFLFLAIVACFSSYSWAQTVSISGGSRTISDTDGKAGEFVTVTASATVTTGSIVSTQWSVNGSLLATGTSTTLALPDGPADVTFKATDDKDAFTTETVTITVKGDSTERDALIALYNSTNGDNWLKKTGWLGAAGTECDWFGIDCSDGQVQSIFLSSNSLSGVLPKELNSFSKLNTFVVGDNSITGSLSALSSMSTLRNLDLRNNLFSGTIPQSLLVLGMPTFLTSGNEGLENVLPIASISGGSRSVKDTDGVAGESVNFMGTIFDHEFSGNNKAYKIPITTEWLVNGSVLSSEPGKNSTSYKIDLKLVDGTNTVVLRVTDHQKAIATDTVIITVGKKQDDKLDKN